MEKNDINETEIKKEKLGYKLSRPSLMRRIGVGALDFLFVLIIFLGLEVFSYQFIFNSLGYTAMIDEVHEIYEDSHLYKKENHEYKTIKDTYQDTITPKENYDEALIYFYTQNARAVKENKIKEYNDAKIASTYFEVNSSTNEVVENNRGSTAQYKVFYEIQYSKAVEFLDNDPLIISNSNKTYLIMMFSILINSVIATSIIYLLCPLVIKHNGQTPSQFFFKVGLCDGREDIRVKKSQIVVRYLVLVIFNFVLPILLFSKFSYFTILPILITCGMICFTKINGGFHDYISKTYLVNLKEVTIPTEKIIVVKDDYDLGLEED